MIEKIKTLIEKIRQDNFSYLSGETKSVQKIPNQWIYAKIFPEKGLPTYTDIELNTGVPMFFVDFIKSLGFEQLTQSGLYSPQTDDININNFSFVHENGYLITMEIDTLNTKNNDVRLKDFIKISLDDIKIGKYKRKAEKNKNIQIRYICDIEILAPSVHRIDNTEFQKLLKTIGNWIVKYDTSNEQPKNCALIHMLIKEDFETTFKDFDVSNFSPLLQNPEIFYGEGFNEFNEKLINRLDNEKKGVVLFHGEPGTGKTHYIRYLLRELTKIDKRVIYIPPSMVSGMMDPSLMSFLVNNILQESRDTILLIEDAEPLLESRESDFGRTTGISNLLNSTDGLLNDILGLVIIATFNTQLSKIDQALLRPGRLMARKEFGRHNYTRSLEIAKELGLAESFVENAKNQESYTIAEICNFSKERKILLHEIKEKRKIGFS